MTTFLVILGSVLLACAALLIVLVQFGATPTEGE